MPETKTTYDKIKEQYLSEVLNYDEDKYREEIRRKADKYGVKYTDFSEQNNFGTAGKNRKKNTIIIITVLTVLVAAGTYIYFKKYRKNAKK